MKIHPFRAWRPIPEKAAEISCVPYDVIDTAEARQMAEGNPHSFLHVIRPEIDVDPNIDIHDDAVYDRGVQNLKNLLASDIMLREPHPSVYVYSQTMGSRTQTGVFTCVSVKEYDSGDIRTHEHTRPDKENDRTRHILSQQAHAEPVMLVHRQNETISRLVNETCATSPLYDFVANDGVRHTLWKSDSQDPWVEAFSSVKRFYVADGHHRCKAASRVASEYNKKDATDVNNDMTDEHEVNYFPAVLFSTNEMDIMAYNRLVLKARSEVLDQLSTIFEVVETGADKPRSPGEVACYFRGQWVTIRLREPDAKSNAVQKLDCYRLQEQILEPLFGISDPRTDENIRFVGGIRGSGVLKNLVDDSSTAIAFSMYPTSIAELLEVSDEGLLMPPKSTWFEPKLRSGLLIHTF